MSFEEETAKLILPLVQNHGVKKAIESNNFSILSKPPFKFIHDVIRNIRDSSGFGQDIFADEPDMWDARKIKEMSKEDAKRAKVKFLTTIQGAVRAALGADSDYMSVSDCLTGKKANQTNEFLQALVEAANRGGDSSSGAAAAPKEKKKERRKERDKEKYTKKTQRKEKEKEKPSHEEDQAPPPRPSAPTPPATPPNEEKEASNDRGDDGVADSAGFDFAAQSVEAPVPSSRPISAKEKAKAPVAEPPAVRTVSTRTVKANAAAEERPKESAAPRVIQEDDDEDSDDDLVVEDAPAGGGLEALAGFGATMGGVPDAGMGMGMEMDAGDGDDGEQHGKLVQNLLQAKADMSSGLDAVPDGIVMQRDRSAKDREATKKEIERLTEALQTLVRSANPLGRAMDYLHEDIESMTKEFDMWRAEARMHQQELVEAQRQTEETLEPLRRDLGLLEEKLDEERAKINGLKASVLQGEEKLLKLLRLRTDRKS